MSRQRLSRRHRWTGILLLLPLTAWAASGLVFLIQPGYEQAYEQLAVRQYAMSGELPVLPRQSWREIRYFQTVLGKHLLVREPDGWHHLHAESGETWPLPDATGIAALLEDAFSSNPERYGNVISVDGNRINTDTGVELSLHWPTLSISQRGRDSRWIDRIYSIHYLQWTGVAALDKLLGIFGLGLLFYMSFNGVRMAFPRMGPQRRQTNSGDSEQ
jgi:hypothetical protein